MATQNSAFGSTLCTYLLFVCLFIFRFAFLFHSNTCLCRKDGIPARLQGWTQLIMDIVAEAGPSDARPDCRENAAMNLIVRPRAIPKRNLQQTDVSLNFFTRILDFAVFRM